MALPCEHFQDPVLGYWHPGDWKSMALASASSSSLCSLWLGCLICFNSPAAVIVMRLSAGDAQAEKNSPRLCFFVNFWLARFSPQFDLSSSIGKLRVIHQLPLSVMQLGYHCIPLLLSVEAWTTNRFGIRGWILASWSSLLTWGGQVVIFHDFSWGNQWAMGPWAAEFYEKQPYRLYRLPQNSSWNRTALKSFSQDACFIMLSVHLQVAIFCRIFDAMRTSLEMGLLHEHPEVRLQGKNASIPAGVCSFVLSFS